MKRSDIDSGFLNRWIFASGQQKQRVAVGGMTIDITPAVKPLQDILGWTGFGKKITWDADAVELFTEFFHSTIWPMQKKDHTGFLTRLDLTLKKLILLFTANQMLDSVPKEMVEKVIAMFKYLVAAYEIPAEHVGNTLQLDVQTNLMRVIKKYTDAGKDASFRDVHQNLKHKKFPPDMLHKMLKILTDLGEIHAYTVNTGKVGRPTVRYKYVG